MSYSKLYAVLVVAVVMTAGVGCIFSGLDDGGQSAEPTLAQQTEQTDVQNDVSVPSLTLGSPVLLQSNNTQTWTSGDCTCTLDTDTGVFTVSGTGQMQDYTNESGQPWYSSSSQITSIVIQPGVTQIGNSCFRSCVNLANINLGSITSIGFYAFSQCSSLESVTIPSTATSIGTEAFGQCTSLESVTIPSSVTSLGGRAFYQCTSLVSVDLGSVTSIGQQAFRYCDSLASVSIPSSVTSIGANAFGGCASLTSIIFETTTWNITSIGSDAFSLGDWTTSVTAIVLSTNNVANGQLNAYGGSYTTFNYMATPTPISVDVTVLYGQHYEYTITTSIPATITISGSQTSWLSLSGNVVSGTVPRQVSSATTLTITAISTQPQQITIQEIEFTLTTSKTFQIGDSLYQDVSMTGPAQPYSVDVRGTGASYTYTQTTAPLKDLGTDLTSITISGTPTVFNSCVFYQAGFTGLIIPDSVTTMAQGSFAGTSLTAVVLGNGLTSIPNQAFVTAMPPQGGTAFHDASGNTLSDIAQIKGHVYTLVSGHANQYIADSQITVNSYNDATCYAVVGRTLQNSDADKLGFSAQLTAYSGTVIDAGIQTAWNSATHTFTVNPAVGTSTVDSNGYLSGTAPGTTGTYNSTATAVTVVGGATITDAVAFHVYVEQVLVITSTPS